MFGYIYANNYATHTCARFSPNRICKLNYRAIAEMRSFLPKKSRKIRFIHEEKKNNEHTIQPTRHKKKSL